METYDYSVIDIDDYVYASDFNDSAALKKYISRKESSTITRPNSPCTAIITSEKECQVLYRMAIQNLPESEVALAEKTVNKWLVGQGGSIALADQNAGLANYYYVRPFTENVARIIRESVYNILDTKVRHNLIIDKPSQLYNVAYPKRKSSGSSIYIGDRRDVQCTSKAIRFAFVAPFSNEFILADVRNKDSKIRNIFNTPASTVYRQARFLHKIFAWWTSLCMDTHYSNEQLAFLVTLLQGVCVYCGDYKGMDFHFTVQQAHLVVDIACDALHASEKDRARLHWFIDEDFHSDVLTGRKIIVGLHNLLSGAYPTHHIECILNFAILATAAVSMGFKVVTEFRKLEPNEVFIGVNGDDSYVIFGRKLSEEERKAFGEMHAMYAGGVGQELELSKVEWNDDFFNFCKNTFALRPTVKSFKHVKIDGKDVPLPKYPLIKALHALYQPENMPPLSWSTAQYIAWACSILDDSCGCQNYKAVVLHLAQQIHDLGSTPMRDAVAELELATIANQLVSSGIQLEQLPESISLDDGRVIDRAGLIAAYNSYQQLIINLQADWWFSELSDWNLDNSMTFQLFKSYFVR